MNTEIIAVKQLPVITEQLAQIKTEVLARTQTATSLICTEQTVKDVKKVRAELNAELKAWEDKRKEVKAAVMAPYNAFEDVYKDCISETYKAADSELKAKIDAVEGELKANKTAEIKDYFEEYAASVLKDADFVTFERAGINVTLSASLKSLKEQAKNYLDKIHDDLILIESSNFEHKAEILVEYKKSLNASEAVMIVSQRIKAIEDEKKRQEEVKKDEVQPEVKAVSKMLTPPEEVEDKIYTLRFTVTATKEKLRKLKLFLESEGIKYE